MNRKVSLGFTLALMLLVAAVTFTITFDFVNDRVVERVNDLRERERTQDKLSQIDREVRLNYNGSIDETALLDSIARGYLAGIGDTYATYYDAKAYERYMSDPDADIGALIQISADGYLQVVEVYPESPAQSAEILAGDLIVKIDDVDVTAENGQLMLASIQGETGTKITLTIRSDNVDRSEELTRRLVPMPSVYSRMLDNNVGYLWIKEFNKYTNDQFKRERDKLVSAGAQSIIFDLRGNPGGLVDAAYRILDLLLPSGPIVSAIDKNGAVELLASSDAYSLELPMVALINGETASSAELFAQVLRDYDKARIVGTQSMGKGVSQKIIPLSDGSAIAITVGTLITPSETIFDGVGVKPDYDVAAESWGGMHQNMMSLPVADFTAADAQLKKAIEVAVALHRTGEALQSQAESSGEESQPPESSVPETSASEPELSEPETSDPGEESSESETSEPEESSGEDESSEETAGEDDSSGGDEESDDE